MTKTLSFAAVISLALVACAGNEEVTEQSGNANIASEEKGDRVESIVTSTKNDDSLKVTFDRKANSVTFAPKYGQARTVEVDSDEMPMSAAAANRIITDSFEHARTSAAKSSSNVKTSVYQPPAANCLEPCEAACDSLGSACMANICKFGCGFACGGK